MSESRRHGHLGPVIVTVRLGVAAGGVECRQAAKERIEPVGGGELDVRSHPIRDAELHVAIEHGGGPLDVAVSYPHHRGGSLDDAIAAMAQRGFETPVGAEGVHEVYGSWSEHVLSWTRKPHPAIYVMRYEDMLADPLQTFGGLARHLLLDAGPEQIGEAIERSSFARLRRQEEQEGFVEKPKVPAPFFREGRASQWQDVLSRPQIERIVRDHGEQMARFNYLPA